MNWVLGKASAMKIINLLFVVILLGGNLFAQSYRKIENIAFTRGEKLTFRVAFNSALTGSITAGKATLEVTPENKTINNRNTYHVVGQGSTSGIVELFFKIDDRFDSYFDEDAIISWQFSRRTRENRYKKDDVVNFRQKDKMAVSLSRIMKVPANIQDMLSAFYYARTLDVSTMKPGDFFSIPYFLDDSVYQSKVEFAGRETVKTKMGKFKCIVFKPMVATGRAFDNPFPITIWVTDDANHLPVLIESEQTVGRARIELIAHEGLLNPIEASLR